MLRSRQRIRARVWTSKMDVSATIGFRSKMASAGVSQDRSQELLGRPVDEVEPDEHLMFKINRGDKEALSSLFRRYAVLVRSVGKRILRDTGEADDRLQEVFPPEKHTLRQFKRVRALLDHSSGLHSSAFAQKRIKVPWILFVRNHRQASRM